MGDIGCLRFKAGEIGWIDVIEIFDLNLMKIMVKAVMQEMVDLEQWSLDEP